MTETVQDLPHAVPLEGASNLRDLGGWPVADGRRVRRGLVYRSATLANLTEADQALVASLGIRTVCDLRGVSESALRPSRLPPSAERVHLPIEPSVGASLRDLMLREESAGEDVVSLLRRAYLDYLARFIDVYRGLFGLLLEPGRQAVLFHCSAGKDRTGVGAALVLTALGATREVVVADYRATDRIWRRDPFAAGGHAGGAGECAALDPSGPAGGDARSGDRGAWRVGRPAAGRAGPGYRAAGGAARNLSGIAGRPGPSLASTPRQQARQQERARHDLGDELGRMGPA